MANKYKGEVAFGEIDGHPLILVFTINAMVEMEDALGDQVVELGVRLASGGINWRDLRTMVRWGLSTYHPELDEIAAGEVISQLGITDAMSLVTEAFTGAFGMPEPAEGEDAPASGPRKGAARVGAGRAASRSGASTSSGRKTPSGG
jgi:hypothetical protein